jgi:exopolyphosphatase/guanosine-5'-triphosphate,3'-diphosphate pyrophosphatase
LLCEYGKQGFGHKEKHLIVTRMGQGLSASGVISEDAMKRNLDALSVFKAKAELYGAQELIAIATSAVRDAENREEFVNAAKEQTGIEIKVISGDLEADLGITGVVNDYIAESTDILVIDIGGGSTELVLGDVQGVKYSKSVNAGTVRMTERFITSHPLIDHEIHNLNKNLVQLFEEPINHLKRLNIKKAVAIGGTATTIAAIYHSMCIYDPQKVHNTVIDFAYLQNLLEKLKNMSVEQRYEIKGLQKERADVIPAGIIIMIHIMKSLGLQCYVASENDNLEGAIIKFTS